jgi:8-oxo-dGTP pyrophosphatase MutT (NUDIX family)
MFIKIYFNDKPLFLCDKLDKELEPFIHHDDAIFIDEFSHPAVNSMIYEMQQEKVHAGIFLVDELEKLKLAFWKKFLIIPAGGGLVKNENEETLFMFRRGKWDLPKGKLDPGETIAECSLREVAEETGLKGVTLERFLLTTYHTYNENGKHILKESHWYTMVSSSKEKLIPQAEEDIHELKWVKKDKFADILSNTYPSVIDVIECSNKMND